MLAIAATASLALSGCMIKEIFTEPLRGARKDAQAEAPDPASPDPNDPSPSAPQLERDPVRPDTKRQVGFHYDPNVFDQGVYKPDELKNMITSPGFDGLAQHTYAEAGGDFDVFLNRDGQRMIFSTTRYSRNPDICMQSVKGKAVTLVTSDPASDMMPSLHPSERMVAWCSNRYGNWDVLVKDINQSPRVRPTQVTFSTDDEIHPTWTQDGKLLAYSRYNSMDGIWKIWIWDSATKTMSDITEGLFPEFRPAPERDGIYSILYQKHRKRDVPWYSIWSIKVRMNPDGAVELASSPTEIVANDKWACINPAWSPDGKFIAFASVRKSALAQWEARIYKADDIWTVKADGTELTQITSHSAPDWGPFWARSPEGRASGRIYFNSLRNGHENIWSARPLVASMLASDIGSDDEK
jgi:TolB protein